MEAELTARVTAEPPDQKLGSSCMAVLPPFSHLPACPLVGSKEFGMENRRGGWENSLAPEEPPWQQRRRGYVRILVYGVDKEGLRSFLEVTPGTVSRWNSDLAGRVAPLF